MKQLIKRQWSLVLFALYLLVVIVYVAINGENTLVWYWDNLDQDIAWLTMLHNNNLFFSHSGTVPFLGGLDRNLFYISELKAYTWLFVILEPFVAFIALYILKFIMCLAGSIFFTKSWLKEDYEKYKHIIVMSSFVYSMMPTVPFLAFAFASIPFLLGVIYNLYNSKKWYWYVALLFYPILSDLSRFGLFICGYLLLFFIIDWIVNRRPLFRLFTGVVLLSVGYLVTEYRLVYAMYLSGVTSVREKFFCGYESWASCKCTVIDEFLNGTQHALSLQKYVIVPVCVLYLLVVVIYAVKNKNGLKITRNPFVWAMICIIFNCSLYIFDYYEPARTIIVKIIPLISGIKLYQAVWLNCFLWSFCFCYALCDSIYLMKTKDDLKRIVAKDFIYKIVVYFLIVATLIIDAYGANYGTYNDFSNNLKQVAYKLINGTERKSEILSWREYYADDLFDDILEDIDYNDEYCLAFGLSPSILNYNGIFTLDGNCNFYPLEYKDKFRTLIQPTLDTYPEFETNFENKGINVVAWMPEYQALRTMETTNADLLVDPDVLREMGCKYVFSRVYIDNTDEIGLELVGEYANDTTPYEIKVYEVIE